jgi:uncharacterized membrane protein
LKAWLVLLSEQVIAGIDLIALAAVVAGTLEACATTVWSSLSHVSGHELRVIWVRYARWLVGALTLQLGADIIETSISTSWDTIGRVAAIAVIRTLLEFFLDRDLEERRSMQRAADRSSGSSR